ncbi:MAG: hypothetical protein FWF81_12545 [Defluviitaleaceae bacterium]|nr:hypothetical protein [Defluviitaleaceae bacterium]
MENENNAPNSNSNDDFYAVVSALARFIETADNDATPNVGAESHTH